MRKMEKFAEANAVITDSLIKSLIIDVRLQARAAANAQYEYWRTGSYPPADESAKWYDAFVKTLLTLGQLGIYAEWEIGIAPGDVKIATNFSVAGYTPAGIIEAIAREYADMTFIGHDEQDNACLSKPAQAAVFAASEQPAPAETDEDQMLTVKFSPACGVSIVKARRLTAAEKENCADWYKEFGLVALGEVTPLPHLGWEDLLPDYPTDGAFQGCANRAWIISEDEAAAYKRLEAKRAQAEEKERIREHIKQCKEIVKACEAGYMVDTEEQAIQHAAAYNRLHNEGGESYTPTWYTRSKYDEALAYIAEHDK